MQNCHIAKLIIQVACEALHQNVTVKSKVMAENVFYIGPRTAMPIIMAKTDKALMAKIHIIIRYLRQ